MNVNLINELSAEAARDAFHKCCGCDHWADAMTRARPYLDEAALNKQVQRAFSEMGREDWLQAFAAHPKIGDIESLRQKYASTKAWAQGEQYGVNGANDEVLHGLAAGNAEYEKRYGHIFIVCATGKTAAEMLAILNSRLRNDIQTEFQNAAEEQLKITMLRLEKL